MDKTVESAGWVNKRFQGIPTPLKVSFLILCTLPLLMVGFVEDSPGAVAPLMNETGVGGVDDVGYLYTWYFMLVPFYCIYSGMVMDRMGFAFALSACLLQTLLGTLTTTMAAVHSAYPLMVMGRILSGTAEAMESILIAYLAILCRGSLRWEGFAFALTNVMMNLGNVILFFLVPPLLKYGYLYSLGTTVLITLLAIIANCIVVILDKRFLLTKVEGQQVMPAMKLSDIWHQTPTFWILCLASSLNLGIYYTVISFSVLYLYSSGYTTEEAGYIPAICSLLSLFSPLHMLLIDRFNVHKQILSLGALVNIVCFILLACNLKPSSVFLILLGVLYTSSDPIYLQLIASEVPQNFLGTAFSIQTMLHALLHILLPAAGGAISVEYGWPAFFMFFTAASVLNMMILFLYFFAKKYPQYFSSTTPTI